MKFTTQELAQIATFANFISHEKILSQRTGLGLIEATKTFPFLSTKNARFVKEDEPFAKVLATFVFMHNNDMGKPDWFLDLMFENKVKNADLDFSYCENY